MFLSTKNKERQSVFLWGIVIGLMVSLTSVRFSHGESTGKGAPYIESSDADKKGQVAKTRAETFSSPEDAVKSLVDALSANDEKKLSAIFGSGPDAKRLVSSGDEVADKAARERFLKAYQEKNRIVEAGSNKAVLEIGNDAWPFPIPIEKVGKDWRFSTKEGKEEIVNRRIGKNELAAIQVCLAYVDAQRDFASKDRNGDGILEYAQKFMSDPGKQNGLYWEVQEGEEQSPLGPLIGEAQKAGYKKKSENEPTPYHGYFYKVLTAQGKDAPRGSYNYVANGRMTGGFAMAAYPAEYGSSGIKTFIVSHDGVVYEKDLGRDTASIAQRMLKFNPDKSWEIEESKHEDISNAEDED